MVDSRAIGSGNEPKGPRGGDGGLMLTVAEACARVLADVSPLPMETVPLMEALGRVLAEAPAARRTQPPVAVSAMDGWAVCSADLAETGATLTPIGEVPTGSFFHTPLQPGTCARIFTGAALPEGADAVVLQENVRVMNGLVVISSGVSPGNHIRPEGLDFIAGATPFAAGRCLTVRDIGLLAAMNLPWVKVHRRPRIAVVSTGNEIVLPGDPLGPAQIVSANGPALCAFVTAAGGVPIHLGVAPDTPTALAEVAHAAQGMDVLVTSGGASVGAHDLVQAELSRHGMELGFWKILMRPGKPLLFGRMASLLVLGLPGNPVSANVCALLFLRPLLRRLQGLDAGQETITLPLASPLAEENDQREDYVRARLLRRPKEDAVSVEPYPRQDSSMLSVLALADALIIRPPGDPAHPVGSLVRVLCFPTGPISF